MNFVDLDFVMVGPVVRDVSASFDKNTGIRRWLPNRVARCGSVNATQLEKLRTMLSSNQRAAESSRYATTCVKAMQSAHARG